MAVGPLVVTRNENKGLLELIEQVQPVEEDFVAAQRAAVLEIPVVNHERQLVIGVDVGDDVGKLRVALRAVRHITNQRERESALSS